MSPKSVVAPPTEQKPNGIQRKIQKNREETKEKNQRSEQTEYAKSNYLGSIGLIKLKTMLDQLNNGKNYDYNVTTQPGKSNRNRECTNMPGIFR